ncbi:hypothetical protein [Brevibacillus daliensis]|uniref:hypothetical protein n=1 Tax=Brevibacillus daliensis TaxID=2892995 RepID=UPI00210223AF|nr:hypothetical protein [Brevibacillus daliensis]
MHTVVSNERKLGGAVEADVIKLRSGEEYHQAVITRLEMSDAQFCSIGFVTKEGKRLIVHIQDISMIVDARHVNVGDLSNEIMREQKVAERLKHLKLLCDLNKGSCTIPFQEEAERLVFDIGLELAMEHVSLPFLLPEEQKKLVRIA